MKTKEEALNTLIKDSDTNKISDGYHTFGELYEHRIVLFMSICRMIYNYEPYNNIPVWMSKKHSDGSYWNGWFILGIHTQKGMQMTYHIPINKWDECIEFARELDKAPEFDGHTSDDILKRISVL